MIEFIKFIFSDLWIWLGFAILFSILVKGIVKIIESF